MNNWVWIKSLKLMYTNDLLFLLLFKYFTIILPDKLTRLGFTGLYKSLWISLLKKNYNTW